MRCPLSLPKRLVIFDLDGVVYRGKSATVGAAQVLNMLSARGVMLRFLTNNSSQSRIAYAEKLRSMEIHVQPEQVMTSAFATGHYLRELSGTDALVLTVGEEGLREELRIAGIRVAKSGEEYCGETVSAVVVGIDWTFTYQKMLQAQQAIFRGARFVATNRDPTFPTETGDHPGGGAIVAAIATAAGKEPELVGKPNTLSLDLILDECGIDRKQAVLVGDRLDTDIHVGRQAGIETVLTLTGVTTREEAEAAPAEMQPHAIIPDLRSLPALLEL